jgi:hypothetical protein
MEEGFQYFCKKEEKCRASMLALVCHAHKAHHQNADKAAKHTAKEKPDHSVAPFWKFLYLQCGQFALLLCISISSAASHPKC